MEPLSILGAAGSIISIIDVASRCISSLRALQQRWKDADMAVALMMGQISTVKAALEQISQWIQTDADTLLSHYQLVMDLELALHSSRLSITFIHDNVTTLMRDEYNALTFKSKARAMTQDNTVQQCAKHLNNQTVALNLLLTALNCRSLSEQRSLLLDNQNRKVIEQVKDDSSSLVCLLDTASIRSSQSGSTDRASLWSRVFEFDGDLLGSKVYKGQIRSLMKGAMGKREETPETSNLTTSKDSEDELNGVDRGPLEILLLGPDSHVRFLLLGKLQSLSDRAVGTSSRNRYQSDKDKYIRYYLPGILRELCSDRDIRSELVSTIDQKASATLQGVLQYKGSFHADESHTQVMDALATLWMDEKRRPKLINALGSGWSFDRYRAYHTLDMIVEPEILPSTADVIKIKWRKSENVKVTLKVWLNPEKYPFGHQEREAQGEPRDSDSAVALFNFIDLPYDAKLAPNQPDQALLRIFVVDLSKLYRHRANTPIPKNGPGLRLLQRLGIEDYMDDALYANLPSMIVLTCGDAFLYECAIDTLREFSIEYGFNDVSQSVKRSMEEQLEQGFAFSYPFEMDVHVMWNYDDAELYRLCSAIRDLQARTATFKDKAA